MQQLFKHLNESVISTALLSALLALPANFNLNLNDSEFVMLSFRSSQQY